MLNFGIRRKGKSKHETTCTGADESEHGYESTREGESDSGRAREGEVACGGEGKTGREIKGKSRREAEATRGGKIEGEGERERKLKIAWVTTRPIKGSGGYRTIFQRAKYLQDNYGATCDLFILPDPDFAFNEESIRAQLMQWFGFDAEGIYYVPEIPTDYDCAIATYYTTAEFVAIQQTPKKVYFIQDFEPYFFPVGDEYLKAMRSYRIGLEPITLGRWLAKKVAGDGSAKHPAAKQPATNHQQAKHPIAKHQQAKHLAAKHPARFSDFGADLEIYNDQGLPRESAICAIYQPEKSRRAPQLLLDALRIIADACPNVTIYLFGSESGDIQTTNANIVSLGLLTPGEMAGLFNMCSLGISLSTTNPSRLPFEMMACGLPVIELAGENTDDDLASSDISLVKPTATAIAQRAISLISNEAELEHMSAEALEFMAGRTLERENAEFADALMKILAGSVDDAPAEVLANTADNEASEVSSRAAGMSANNTATMGISEAEAAIIRKKYSEVNIYPLVRGASLKLEVKVANPPMELVSPVCGFWRKPDQSDLQWVFGVNESDKWSFDLALGDSSNSDNVALGDGSVSSNGGSLTLEDNSNGDNEGAETASNKSKSTSAETASNNSIGDTVRSSFKSDKDSSNIETLNCHFYEPKGEEMVFVMGIPLPYSQVAGSKELVEINAKFEDGSCKFKVTGDVAALKRTLMK